MRRRDVMTLSGDNEKRTKHESLFYFCLDLNCLKKKAFNEEHNGLNV